MTGFILSLLGEPTLLAVGGGIIAAFIAFMKGRMSGASLERQKQAASEKRARDVADQVENDLSAFTSSQARERLRKWSKP